MVENIAGVILRETPIGEADKMMTVLTAKYGRISVFARGAKRLKSPLFTASQLFSYSELTISKSASTQEGISPVKTNGIAPVTDIKIQASETVKNPSLA